MGSSATLRNDGQNGFAEELGEGLALFVAALALAFQAMAEDFVEEDGRGAAAEDGGAVEGLGDRARRAALPGSFAITAALARSVFWSGRCGGRVGLEGLVAEHVHAVGGAGAGHDDESGGLAGRGDPRAFGGDEVVGLVGGFELDLIGEDVGILR